MKLLTAAGGSSLCTENELNLAFASKGGLDIINMFCQYWVKPCAYLMGAVWILSIVIHLAGVLGFALCPDCLYRCKKRLRGLPNDYSDFKDEFKSK